MTSNAEPPGDDQAPSMLAIDNPQAIDAGLLSNATRVAVEVDLDLLNEAVRHFGAHSASSAVARAIVEAVVPHRLPPAEAHHQTLTRIQQARTAP